MNHRQAAKQLQVWHDLARQLDLVTSSTQARQTRTLVQAGQSIRLHKATRAWSVHMLLGQDSHRWSMCHEQGEALRGGHEVQQRSVRDGQAVVCGGPSAQLIHDDQGARRCTCQDGARLRQLLHSKCASQQGQLAVQES